MNNSKICRFCLRAGEENFLPVLEVTKEMLDVLLVKIDLDVSGNPVMCKECIENFQKCFEFKSVCILTEENVVDFLKLRKICKTNMTQVYLKDVKNNFDLFNLKEVCRFCTKSVTKFFTVDELDKDINFSNMVQQFLPEVKLCVTSNPVTCSNCLNSLKNYFAFLKNCRDVEEHIKEYCKDENIANEKVDLQCVVQYMLKHLMLERIAKKGTSRLKKSVTIDQSVETYPSNSIKTEIIVKEEQDIEINSSDMITTEIQPVEIFPSDSGDPKICIMKERNTKDLSLEEIKNEISDDVFLEGCSDENNIGDIDMSVIKMEDIETEPNNFGLESDLSGCSIKQENNTTNITCSDESNTNMGLKELVVTLKRGQFYRTEENPKQFQCFYCKYKSGSRRFLVAHRIYTHQIRLLSCHSCDYRTFYEDCLKKHLVIHGDNGKFICPECEKVYRTKQNIENHFLRAHDNLRDLVTSKIHSCNICRYKTTRTTDLSKHLNTKHSLLEKYRCNYCLRTFFHKESLSKHISSIHVKLGPYICECCKKDFFLKCDLDNHIVTRHPENVDLMETVKRKIYKCDHCPYRCVRISEIRTHENSCQTINI